MNKVITRDSTPDKYIREYERRFMRVSKTRVSIISMFDLRGIMYYVAGFSFWAIVIAYNVFR